MSKPRESYPKDWRVRYVFRNGLVLHDTVCPAYPVMWHNRVKFFLFWLDSEVGEVVYRE